MTALITYKPLTFVNSSRKFHRKYEQVDF